MIAAVDAGVARALGRVLRGPGHLLRVFGRAFAGAAT